jgi:hypothetical protein
MAAGLDELVLYILEGDKANNHGGEKDDEDPTGR